MIQPERIKIKGTAARREGEYVLYWMQAAQRAEYNHALEYAIEEANKLKKPLVVVFCLVCNYPDANERHYYFMLEGLKETEESLKSRNIRMAVLQESPESGVVRFSERAALVVVDAGHLRVQRKWRKKVAGLICCPLIEVETNLIVPVEAASDKEDYSAGTFRPRINRQLDRFLVKLRHRRPKIGSLDLRFDSLPLENIDKVISKLDIDRSVGKVSHFTGGTSEAKRRLKTFIKDKLDNYSEDSRDPNLDCISNMSPYLHFGQISPLFVALEVLKTSSPGKDAYLEQLIVRRELSHNFVYYNANYDSFKSLPPWAVRTLNYHRRDKNEYVYSLEQLEAAQTHDVYWNAAQQEMVLTGKMHNYMRMYWGKKIIEWTRSPQTAFKIALYLNNKYELDGRDPNGFAGVAWCFGKHDRAWTERPIFGKIRYMNSNGLKRKFDADGYVKKVENLRTIRK
ncbi:MAG: deoxyribodipyrimidine photo-lyase [Planctomycetota bacterium]|jgi:deoxyribodipyrimidine photo-lyase